MLAVALNVAMEMATAVEVAVAVAAATLVTTAMATVVLLVWAMIVHGRGGMDGRLPMHRCRLYHPRHPMNRAHIFIS